MTVRPQTDPEKPIDPNEAFALVLTLSPRYSRPLKEPKMHIYTSAIRDSQEKTLMTLTWSLKKFLMPTP